MVLIDPQKGVIGRPLAPRSGALVVMVKAGFAPDFKDALRYRMGGKRCHGI